MMTINKNTNIAIIFFMGMLLLHVTDVQAENEDFGTFLPYPEGGAMQVFVEPDQNEYTGANDSGYDTSMAPFGEGFTTVNIIESV